jgi:hypothetical protein
VTPAETTRLGELPLPKSFKGAMLSPKMPRVRRLSDQLTLTSLVRWGGGDAGDNRRLPLRCGALHGNSAPALVGICHCRDCQKFTGSAFGFLVGVPRDAFEMRGTVKSYNKPADSGRPIVRRFCPECGSSIAEEPGSRPDLVILNGGTLDDPNSLKPAMQIYCDRELSWVQLDCNMQRFPGMPS